MIERKPYKWNIFKSGDPRARLTKDRWGDDVVVVGEATRHDLSIPRNGMEYFGGETIVKRLRDNALMALHPKSVE